MVSESLDRADWERILYALSQFRHNPAFRETHDKVAAILSPPGPT